RRRGRMACRFRRRGQRRLGPCGIVAVPWKQSQGTGQARDETKCRPGQPHAPVLPELTGGAKIAELWVKLVRGELRGHGILLRDWPSPRPLGPIRDRSLLTRGASATRSANAP